MCSSDLHQLRHCTQPKPILIFVSSFQILRDHDPQPRLLNLTQRDLRANRAARLAAAADPCPPNDEWSAFLLRDSRHRHEAAHMLDRQSAWYTPPQPSVFLRPGTTFKGTQLVSRRSHVREDWDVVVSIEVCIPTHSQTCIPSLQQRMEYL